jgi:ABC-type sugar transport system permease subunit
MSESLSSEPIKKTTVFAPPSRYTLRQIESMMGYLLVAPLIICVLVLVVYPFLFAILISFTDRTVGAGGAFVGFDNFINLINKPDFVKTIWNTLTLVTAVQLSKLFIGLAVALLLNEPVRGRQFWRGLILLPWAMPAFVAFITWKLLYSPQGGAFNYILIKLNLVQTHVDFLGTRALAMPSVVTALVWRGFPFWVITFLAGLQGVPEELYEAAALDGANAWQRFLHVTLPGIRYIVLVVILVSTIGTTNNFEGIFLLTAGGPSNATMTFPVYAYFSLQNLNLGVAAEVGVAMLPAFACLAFVMSLLMKDVG